MTAIAPAPTPATPPAQGHVHIPPQDQVPGAAPPTELTRSLLNALDRPPLPLVTPGIAKVLLIGLLTAGLWPAFALARKWLNTLRWHRYVMWHLAEWASINLGSDAASQLHAASYSTTSRWLARGAMAMALASAALALFVLVQGLGVRSLWLPGRSAPPPVIAYVACLSGSFLLTWLSVNFHLPTHSRLLRTLQQVAPPAARQPSVRLASFEPGLRPIPMIVALLLALAGIFWSIPMLLAASAQRRAVRVHHAAARWQLAGQMRAILARRRPVMVLPPTVGRVQTCRNAICDERLPLQARFCPRCGLPQKPISQFME